MAPELVDGRSLDHGLAGIKMVSSYRERGAVKMSGGSGSGQGCEGERGLLLGEGCDRPGRR